MTGQVLKRRTRSPHIGRPRPFEDLHLLVVATIKARFAHRAPLSSPEDMCISWDMWEQSLVCNHLQKARDEFVSRSRTMSIKAGLMSYPQENCGGRWCVTSKAHEQGPHDCNRQCWQEYANTYIRTRTLRLLRYSLLTSRPARTTKSGRISSLLLLA
jgi:hypothetical protein